MTSRYEVVQSRVRLRPLRLSDAADVFAYASDPLVAHYVDWEPHRSLAESTAFIERVLAPHWHAATFAVELTAQRRVIGTFELRIASRGAGVGDIGYVLARPFWGLGYNVEAGIGLLYYAFRLERLRRVEATCHPENRRSYRTLEKLGFRREACPAPSNGSASGYLRYSLLAAEWERHPIHRRGREIVRLKAVDASGFF